MSRQVVIVGAMSLLIPFQGTVAADLAPPKLTVIKLDMPPPRESEGGLIVADVDSNGEPDYLVSVPGTLAVYANNGDKLWVKATDLVVGGEEIVVLNGSELHVYSNVDPNPRSDQERLWSGRNYRRMKQAHNYYSP